MALEHSGELSEQDELYRIRHSLAHVLAQAVLEMRPGTTLGFGPPIRDGLYYDFVLSSPITEEHFVELEQKMRKILKEIQTGAYAQEFLLENQTGATKLNAMRRIGKQHQIEVVGEKLRDMMPWIKRNRLVDQSKN